MRKILYETLFVGGPSDGVLMPLSLKRYHVYQCSKDGVNNFYVMSSDGEVWLDDWTRRITLTYWQGVQSFEEIEEFLENIK